jgi:hypothetical protein
VDQVAALTVALDPADALLETDGFLGKSALMSVPRVCRLRPSQEDADDRSHHNKD